MKYEEINVCNFLLWVVPCAVVVVLSVPLSANAGGVSAVKACEADTNAK
jgi:hypothetical protein